MEYFLKKLSKIHYTALVALSPISWGILCTAFGYFLILTRADFEATGTKMLFILGCPVYMVIAAILSVIKYGGFDILQAEERKKKIDVLNKYVKRRHVSPNISTRALKKVFSSLVELPIDGFKTSLLYGSLVMLFALIAEWVVGGATSNLLVILISAIISLFLLSLFITFFAQRFIFPTLMECRAMLNERGETIEEPRFRFSDLETKFRFFLLIPILVVLVVLTLVSVLDIGVIIISLIGLIMAIMVSQQLSSSIYDAFLGIKEFAKKLPGEQRTAFSTGSLDAEIIDLSESLNKASDEVYTAREKVKRSEKELRKRLEELERWYKLTAGRELRMAELKKELAGLKKK